MIIKVQEHSGKSSTYERSVCSQQSTAGWEQPKCIGDAFSSKQYCFLVMSLREQESGKV